MREEFRTGLDYVEAVTTLLQRRRQAHPTAGLYEAAELQFWWSRPHPTDDLDQLFWFDDAGQPEAAAIFVDFSDKSTSLVYKEVIFCPFVLPGSSAEHVKLVIDRGLAHAANRGIEAVALEVDQADQIMRDVLHERGFTVKEERVLTWCWLAVENRVEISALSDGYRLASRAETTHMAHHMSGPTSPAFEERLQKGSLYRPDLDLVMLDENDAPAAYAMFWFDPTTSTGVVEPMRTHDEHQQKGLARHLLTSGVDRLARLGAARVAIGYEPENPASGQLDRSVGFEPHTSIDLFAGPTNSGA